MFCLHNYWIRLVFLDFRYVLFTIKPYYVQFNVNKHISMYPACTSMNISNAVGFLLLLTLCLQIITGVLLATAYDCSWHNSFSSIIHIVNDVQNGYIVQHLHVMGATYYMILLFAHWLRSCWNIFGMCNIRPLS